MTELIRQGLVGFFFFFFFLIYREKTRTSRTDTDNPFILDTSAIIIIIQIFITLRREYMMFLSHIRVDLTNVESIII